MPQGWLDNRSEVLAVLVQQYGLWDIPACMHVQDKMGEQMIIVLPRRVKCVEYPMVPQSH